MKYPTLFVGRVTVFGLLAASTALAQPESPLTRPLSELLQVSQRSTPATVVATITSRLSAEISAAITEMPLKVGDQVAANTVVARLNCADYTLQQAALDAEQAVLQARLDLATRQAQRAETLLQNRNISLEEQDNRQTEVRILNAQLGQLRIQREQIALQIRRCEVRTPFNAAVVAQLAHVGEYAQPGTPLWQLLDVNALEVSAELLPVDALSFPETAQFHTANATYSVNLRSRLPQIDAIRRTHEIRLQFTERGSRPTAGSPGHLSWNGPPVLPTQWLVKRGDALGIFTVENQRLRFIALPDAREGLPVQIADQPRTLPVLIRGRETAMDGDLIESATP